MEQVVLEAVALSSVAALKSDVGDIAGAPDAIMLDTAVVLVPVVVGTVVVLDSAVVGSTVVALDARVLGVGLG